MKGKLSRSDIDRLATLDQNTRGVVTVVNSHHQIHDGESYHAFYTNESVGNNVRHVLSFKTPNTAKYIHMVAEVESTGEAEFKLYEGITITDNTGTSRKVYNRRRNSGNTSGVLDTGSNPDLANRVTLDASMGSGSAFGEVIEHIVLGAGKNTGGTLRGNNEWILSPNTNYAFSFVSRSADNKMFIHLDWYEYTNKNLTENG